MGSVLYMISPSAHALDLDGLTKKTISPVRVKLVFVYDGDLFRSKLNESSLLQVGCTYQTDEIRLIDDLLRVLKEAEIAPLNGQQEYVEPRYAVYLVGEDGKETSIIFDRKYINLPRVYGMVDGSSAVANVGLGSDLVTWAERSGLQQINPDCRTHLHKKT
jgi:hypothetical protein